MPTESQHKGKVERNRAFLDTIAVDVHPEWAAVVAFYTAVHLVEQLRAANSHGDSTGHEDRLRYVQTHHVGIHSPYHFLQNISMLSRYQSVADFYSQFDVDDIRDRVIGDYLPRIERYVAGRLGT